MPLILKIAIGLSVWFVISVPSAFLFIGLMNLGRGCCFFHGSNRRKVIETGGWEYFDCPKCGIREAEKSEDAGATAKVHRSWLKGRSWLG